MPTPNRHVITTVHVFVSVDPDGNEGILATTTTAVAMPMIATEDHLAELLSRQALAIATAFEPTYSGWTVRHLRFTDRQVVVDNVLTP